MQPGATPRTTFGLLVHALSRRRARGSAGLAVVSCDNIAGNGHLTERVVTALADRYESGLREWISAEVTFPNSMVDRITPATTDRDRAELEQRFGVHDEWPVVCEPFHQWVLEDRFPHGRPALERAGVQLVDDVGPYELMKLRLLNASHQALAHLGRLAGYQFVHEAAGDTAFTRFLRGWMEQEARPTLPPVPGIDLDSYTSTLLRRFANPEIQDTVARLAVDASDRIPTFVVPVVRERLAAGARADRGALVLAAWTRCVLGTDDADRPIEHVDRQSDRLSAAAARQRDDPLAFLRQRDLFGDLADDDVFARSYLQALRGLEERGARAMAQERS